MPQDCTTPDTLLAAAYKDLHLDEGQLLPATDAPLSVSREDWMDNGEWLSLARAVGAERVFFVDNNPVIVFAQDPSSNPDDHRQLFQRIWNMARPPLLFLATPGQLAVYDLTAGPARTSEDWSRTLKNRRLELAQSAVEVSERLQAYRRERIETGRLFEEARFGQTQRADKALVANLRSLRRALIREGLSYQHAHSLIGRSIFIRYLEDRDILKPDYFRQVARGNPRWGKILETAPDKPHAAPELAQRAYMRILSNHDFTYALFDRLAKDFNGDMFPESPEERKKVTQQHLNLLQGFLCGEPVDDTPNLFFFAYKFDVIPIELISSIYEEFYAKEDSSDQSLGTHYTPPALVDFVLSQVLSSEVLDQRPHILDPAVGSGIFLVEAFCRIVRHRVYAQRGRRLSNEQLRSILRDQLAGIDINGEAVRVAAFSLYLALLHYQSPPDILEHIRQGRPLPNLKYEQRSQKRSRQHFDILLEANAFDVESRIGESETTVRRRFSSECADVVVGNPPWGSPGTGEEDRSAREALDVALAWCGETRLVGDREWSQAFIHRALDFLREGGQAGLLVSTGVFFKSHDNSRAFRNVWLSSVRLRRVVNFAHVRHVFFQGEARASGAQSPFASVVFEKATLASERDVFAYWSAKRTAMVEGMQSVVLSKADLQCVRQERFAADDRLWKVYWWGGHRDEALIGVLGLDTPLEQLHIQGTTLENRFGQGFIEKGDKNPCPELKKYHELPKRSFHRYGPLPLEKMRPPPKVVHRKGNLGLYEGLRLLVSRGIPQEGESTGTIVARMATQPFCFRNSIHGVRLPDGAEREAKVLLGIFWSSLARYYFWLTAGSWLWHNEIHLEDVRQMPIRMPASGALRERITQIVDSLRKAEGRPDLLGLSSDNRGAQGVEALERQLDEAIFDLYELTAPERELVRDMCEVGLDLFYRGAKSDALKPAVDRCCGSTRGAQPDYVQRYVQAFLDSWSRAVADDKVRLDHQIICPEVRPPTMLAAVFSTMHGGRAPSQVTPLHTHTAEWESLLRRLEETSLFPCAKKQIYIEGMVRVVTDTKIILIKRNEKRLWTASMAREDAEATLLQAMQLEKATHH